MALSHAQGSSLQDSNPDWKWKMMDVSVEEQDKLPHDVTINVPLLSPVPKALTPLPRKNNVRFWDLPRSQRMHTRSKPSLPTCGPCKNYIRAVYWAY